MSVKISKVSVGSPCDKKGIVSGDKLISVNGNEINDVLDYRFYADDSKLKIVYENSLGKCHHCNIKNADGCDSLGLEFDTFLMDAHRHCLNHCIFCFIDQMPKGMRESLYFKDDDSRLSFLFGNYITLTNLSEHDVERIIKMHISPVNVSVHTMNPELRVKMMRNPNAGKSLKLLNRFSDAGISINAQLVLCPGINDGEELLFSLNELSKLGSVSSVAAVPVGITKYRQGLYQLKKYSKTEAANVIDIIDRFNNELLLNKGNKLAYPSDEFFQLAERQLPNYEYYGDFLQLDNGVGMLTLIKHDFIIAAEDAVDDSKVRNFSIATGVAAYDALFELAQLFMLKFKNTNITVYKTENTYFGSNVTVAGLITGNELINSLKSQGFCSQKLLLPSVMFKSVDEPVFLDDVSKSDVEKELNTKVVICPSDGYNLFETFLAQAE